MRCIAGGEASGEIDDPKRVSIVTSAQKKSLLRFESLSESRSIRLGCIVAVTSTSSSVEEEVFQSLGLNLIFRF